MKQFLLVPLAAILGVLGLIGLLVPVLPGVLFLLGALVCLGVVFPRLRRKLERQPRFNRFFYRLDESRCLGIAGRCKLFFWALLEMLTPGQRSVR